MLCVRLSLPLRIPLIFYAVVSGRTERVVEFFKTSDDARAMIDEVREDEPELAETLRVEVIDLPSGGTN
jgi:hypothetical protein